METNFGKQDFDESKALDEFLEYLETHKDKLTSDNEELNRLAWEIHRHKDTDFSELAMLELEQYEIQINDNPTEPTNPLNFGYPQPPQEQPPQEQPPQEQPPREQPPQDTPTVTDLQELLGVSISMIVAKALLNRLSDLPNMTFSGNTRLLKPYHLNKEVYEQKFSMYDITALCDYISSKLTDKERDRLRRVRPEIFRNTYLSEYPVEDLESMTGIFKHLATKCGFIYKESFSTHFMYTLLIMDILSFNKNFIPKFYDYLKENNVSLAPLPTHLTGAYTQYLNEDLLHGFIISIWEELV